MRTVQGTHGRATTRPQTGSSPLRPWQRKALNRYLMAGAQDFMLVDINAAERARPGNIVIAQSYDNQTGSATTLLRRYEPPVLVAGTPDRDQDRLIHVVDNTNVVILGVVVASWRGGLWH